MKFISERHLEVRIPARSVSPKRGSVMIQRPCHQFCAATPTAKFRLNVLCALYNDEIAPLIFYVVS